MLCHGHPIYTFCPELAHDWSTQHIHSNTSLLFFFSHNPILPKLWIQSLVQSQGFFFPADVNPYLNIPIASWCIWIIKCKAAALWSSWQQCCMFFILMSHYTSQSVVEESSNINPSTWARNSINSTWNHGVSCIFDQLQMFWMLVSRKWS